MIKFILLTTQRSGSTFIRLWLNSHPNVRCHSEIFLRNDPAADTFKTYCETNTVRRLLYYTFVTFRKHRVMRLAHNFVMKRILERFLDKLYNDPSFSAPWTDLTTDEWMKYQPRKDLYPEKAVGFQLMYDQLSDYRPLHRWIESQNIAIIHLIRENALKLLLSLRVAVKTKEWHYYQLPACNGPRPKVFLDPQKTINQLDRIIAKRTEVKKKFQNNPYIEINYEQFFNNYNEESKKILEFLRIADAEMKFPEFLKKINPDSIKELVENYDEIANILNGTPYQKFLD